MKPRQAAVVSYYDLENYFTGNSWEFKRHDDGKVTAQSEAYDLTLQQRPTKYDVKITAEDDPSDSEEGVTDNPVKFITKFLSTGTEADDLLKKMSFVPDPRYVAVLCRRAALMAEVSPDMSGVKRMLRRGMVASQGPGLERFLVAVVRAVAGEGDDAREVSKVTKEMKEKGWKVEQKKEDSGRTLLEVDVSGIYRAQIRAKDTVWDYEFQVRGIDESKESGSTDDPIQKFRLFYKKDSTQEYKKQRKEQLSSEDRDEATVDTDDTDATVKPGKSPKPQTKKKKPASGGSPSSGTEDTLLAPTQLPPSGGTNVPFSNKYSD